MSDSRKISALRFRNGDKVYKLELHPLALSVGGRRIEHVGNGSDRRLQDNQLKVLRYLLERPNQFHSPEDIAAGAALNAKNPTEALRIHLHYLRETFGDERRQLIRTRPAQQRGGATAYGLFAEVEPVVVRARESLRRAAGAALLIVSLICLFFFDRERWFRREPPQRQITTNSPDRPIKAIALSP